MTWPLELLREDRMKKFSIGVLRGHKPGNEEILIWNAFISKRGWRDESSAELQAAKEKSGWGERDDIRTWVDLHDAEEGRTPR